MRQHWCDLAFLHWAVSPDQVAGWMPPGVRPDVFDGVTYVGLIPFRMVGAGVSSGPPVPWLGTFLETNVRLYSVDSTGRRGIVFRSLDADRLAVVLGARAGFGLPYRWARLTHHRRPTARGPEHRYTARTRWPGPVGVRSRVVLRDLGTPVTPDPLDEFLTARWGLHVRHAGRTWYVPNQHPPWDLRAAELVDLEDGLVAAAGLGDVAERAPDRVRFASGVRTTFGRPAVLRRSEEMR